MGVYSTGGSRSLELEPWRVRSISRCIYHNIRSVNLGCELVSIVKLDKLQKPHTAKKGTHYEQQHTLPVPGIEIELEKGF